MYRTVFFYNFIPSIHFKTSTCDIMWQLFNKVICRARQSNPNRRGQYPWRNCLARNMTTWSARRITLLPHQDFCVSLWNMEWHACGILLNISRESRTSMLCFVKICLYLVNTSPIFAYVRVHQKLNNCVYPTRMFASQSWDSRLTHIWLLCLFSTQNWSRRGYFEPELSHSHLWDSGVEVRHVSLGH